MILFPDESKVGPRFLRIPRAQIIINDCRAATAVVRFVKYHERRSSIKPL